MTKETKEELVEEYSQAEIDGWDFDTLYDYAYGKLVEANSEKSLKELKEELEEYNYDELLDKYFPEEE